MPDTVVKAFNQVGEPVVALEDDSNVIIELSGKDGITF